MPSPQWLGAQWPKRTLVDVHAGDALAGLANQTLSRGNTLIDFAPHLGCACAGAVGGTNAQDARKAVIALEPPRAAAEIVSSAVHLEVSLAQTAEHHVAEVTWGDFLAALPAALAMHPEDGAAVPPRQTSRTAPRRALQKKAALPRAYMAARAGVRRERVVKPRAETQQLRALDRVRQGDSPVEASMSRADASSTRREEISLTRPNPWIARRASQEGMTGPRSASPARPGLATADRWLLSGLMLASSVLVAVLTSALTVRGIQGASAPVVVASATPAPTVLAAPAPLTVPVRDTAASIGATHAPDSVIAVAAVHADSAPNHEVSTGTVAPPPSARLSPMPAEVARAPRHIVPRVERRQLATAEHARAQPHSAPPSIAPAVTALPPSISATTVSTQPTPVQSAPPQPAPQVPAPTIASPATAPAAAANANAQVLEELRAIHAEINARKRHVDSLTAALDSLKRVPTPQ